MKYKLIVIIAICLALSGCASSFSSMISGQGTSKGDNVPKVNLGGEGIAIGFLADNPPDKVKKGVGFLIGVELLNKGFEDVTNGIVKVWGCKDLRVAAAGANEPGDNTVFTDTFTLGRTDVNNPAGGRKQFFIRANTVDTEEKCYIRIQACYQYKTRLDQQVCIDPTPSSPEIGEPCKLESPQKPTAQGAPVIVDRIEQMITRYSPDGNGIVEYTFNIYPKNNKKGKVVDESVWELGCNNPSNQDLTKNFNVLKISAWLGQNKIDCNTHTINLSKESDLKKRTYFICTAEVPADRGTFSTLLTVNIYYGYIHAYEKKVEIEGKKTDKFGNPGTVCPVERCFPRTWGYCSGTLGENTYVIFGREMSGQTCDDGKVCCEFETPACERAPNTGHSCQEGCTADQDHKYMCPGSLQCCPTP